MDYDTIKAAAAEHHLDIFGAFHPVEADGAPKGVKTLVLLAPIEPGFWPYLQLQPEWQDDLPDAIDRWSLRIIGALADQLGARPLFPFGGPPYQPFIGWAKRTGRAWDSPVGMLIHDVSGLMISLRGAIALPDAIDLPTPHAEAPCTTCDAPCLTSCPVGALGAAPYDIPRCHSYLDSKDGQECMTGGCLVRQICPVSKRSGRDPEQSAYHMRHFHR